MKTTTKIIFGAALSVFGIAALSNQAWAAQITGVSGNANIQIKEDPADNSAIGVDAGIHKFDLSFKIAQAVSDGDYFDFETHALPDLGDRDVLAGGGDNTVIGKIAKINTIKGGRDYNSSLNTSVVNWEQIKPEDNRIFKYRITFNKNAENRQNLAFDLSVQKVQPGFTISNKNYTTKAWVKLADSEITTKNIQIAGWSKETPNKTSQILSSTSVMDLNEVSPYYRMLWKTFEIRFAEDLKGDFIEIVLPEGSPVKFRDHKDAKTFSNSSIYRFDDNSAVNSHGTIFSPNNMRWGYTGVEFSENKVKFLIDRQTHDNFRSAFWTYFELTESGKRAFAETGTLPEIKPIVKIIKPSGEIIFEKAIGGDLTIRGSVADFQSILKEEIKDTPQEEPKIEEVSKVDQGIEEEIQAPNTGFSGGISALALSAFSLLSLATFFARKK